MEALSDLTLTEICDIETIHSLRGMDIDMNNRDLMGLSFCRSGKIIYKHKEMEFVSDKDCAVILPQGASYRLRRIETGYFPLINFRCSGFSPETFKVIRLKNPESYIRDFDKMHSLSLFEGNRAAIFSIFYDMIDRLCGEEKSEYDILLPADKYISENFSDPQLNNTKLAEICGVSEVYFRKLFKVSRGSSPHKYIIDVRIRHAKKLLMDSDMTVSEISEKVGFSSVYHFCRAFKNKTGMTPGEYSRHNAMRGI